MFIQLDYTLNFEAPSHFGTGIREGLIDRTVIRDADGYLYVPASTFKGVLREHCEHICHFYADNAQEPEHISSPHDDKATLADFGTPTLISLTFGSQLSPCSLRFSDAKQQGKRREDYKNAQTSIFTQVRIDRLTQTAVPEALYTSQFGIRDLSFKGNITGRLDSPFLPTPEQSVNNQSGGTVIPTPNYSLLLLLAGLLLIERLGGNKSTGKGQCNCTIDNLFIDGQRCKKKTWQEWIKRLDALGDYQPEKGRLL